MHEPQDDPVPTWTEPVTFPPLPLSQAPSFPPSQQKKLSRWVFPASFCSLRLVPCVFSFLPPQLVASLSFCPIGGRRCLRCRVPFNRLPSLPNHEFPIAIRISGPRSHRLFFVFFFLSWVSLPSVKSLTRTSCDHFDRLRHPHFPPLSSRLVRSYKSNIAGSYTPLSTPFLHPFPFLVKVSINANPSLVSAATPHLFSVVGFPPIL